MFGVWVVTIQVGVHKFSLGGGGGGQNLAKEANTSLKKALMHIVF